MLKSLRTYIGIFLMLLPLYFSIQAIKFSTEENFYIVNTNTKEIFKFSELKNKDIDICALDKFCNKDNKVLKNYKDAKLVGLYIPNNVLFYKKNSIFAISNKLLFILFFVFSLGYFIYLSSLIENKKDDTLLYNLFVTSIIPLLLIIFIPLLYSPKIITDSNKLEKIAKIKIDNKKQQLIFVDNDNNIYLKNIK